MTNFSYGLPLRPAGLGSAPEGWLKYDENGSYDNSGERDRSTRHGVVTYEKELTDEQIQKFELVPIHNKAYFERYIEKAWNKLGRYAHKYLEMGGEEALLEQMKAMSDKFGPIHPKEYERAEKEILARAKKKEVKESITEDDSFFNRYIKFYYYNPDYNEDDDEIKELNLEEAKDLIKNLPSENPDDYTVEKVDLEKGGHYWEIYFKGKLVGYASSSYKRSMAAKSFIDDWNRRAQAKDQEKKNRILIKEKKIKLEKDYKENKNVIDNAHKNSELEFIAMPIDLFNKADVINGDAILIHKSPVYNNRQSSEYKLMFIDDELVYARKSNHWGSFYTNIKVGDKEAEDDAIPDHLGRVGYKQHYWNLNGGDNNKKISQAGYIPVKNLRKLVHEGTDKEFS